MALTAIKDCRPLGRGIIPRVSRPFPDRVVMGGASGNSAGLSEQEHP